MSLPCPWSEDYIDGGRVVKMSPSKEGEREEQEEGCVNGKKRWKRREQKGVPYVRRKRKERKVGCTGQRERKRMRDEI